MTDPTHWTYTLAADVIDAADAVVHVAETDALDCLDDDLRDAILLVCGTIAQDEAEAVS